MIKRIYMECTRARQQGSVKKISDSVEMRVPPIFARCSYRLAHFFFFFFFLPTKQTRQTKKHLYVRQQHIFLEWLMLKLANRLVPRLNSFLTETNDKTFRSFFLVSFSSRSSPRATITKSITGRRKSSWPGIKTMKTSLVEATKQFAEYVHGQNLLSLEEG